MRFRQLLVENQKFRVGFTLIELMIVVAILGIMAAIVLPEFQSHSQKAKETAAKDNLRILRDAIERYALDHNGIPPGYLNDNVLNNPSPLIFNTQLINSRKYLLKMPRNSFNDRLNTFILKDIDPMPTASVGDYGWIYKPLTKTIKLNKDGVDSEGVPYLDY